MLKHSSHRNREDDSRELCFRTLPHKLAGPPSDLCVRKTVYADGPGLIGAVDPLGRVAQIRGAGVYRITGSAAVTQSRSSILARGHSALRVMIATPT
jgi:hypothetical protein